jgi:tetratricopeptide (TPR) repeat protein
MSLEWSAGRILRELCSEETRLQILQVAWGSDISAPQLVKLVSKVMRFRTTSVQSAALSKKVSWTNTLAQHHLLQPALEDGLRLFHAQERAELMGAFLEILGIPHDKGLIATETYPTPSIPQVQDAARQLSVQFPAEHIIVYLASAGLLMPEWRTECWSSLDVVPPQTPALPAAESEETGVPVPVPVEEWVQLTTLDDLLIKATVASVSGLEGAFSLDQMEDAIEELIHLNSDRQHSYFLRAYLGTLTGRDFENDGIEMNQPRRDWLLAGQVTALGRRSDWKGISALFLERRTEFESLFRKGGAAARSATKPVFDALWSTGARAEAVQALSLKTVVSLGPRFADHLLQLSIDLIVQAKESEARLAMELLEAAMFPSAPDDGLPPYFVVLRGPEVARRRAQCLRAEGAFEKAAERFETILAEAPAEIQASALVDLGLCAGEFRRLSDVRIPRDQAELPQMVERLERAEKSFRQALVAPGSKTNAEYALGVMALLRQNWREARGLLLRAYEGLAMDAGLLERYQKGGLYPHLLMAYGLSILLDCGETQFGVALEVFSKADSLHPKRYWPDWLVKGAVENAVSTSMGSAFIEFVASDFPAIIDDLASNESLLVHSATLQRVLLSIAEDEKRPRHLRAGDNFTLLAFSLRSENRDVASDALDRLELLSQEDESVRIKFLEMLQTPHRYDPAWTEEDALHTRARLLERQGDLEQAGAELQKLAHAYLSDRDFTAAHGVIARIRGLGLGDDYVTPLIGRLPVAKVAVEEVEANPLKRHLESSELNILFIGGAELLQAHDEEVLRNLRDRYGAGLSVRFEHDAWAKGWGRTFDSLKSAISDADAVVLSYRMRTMLGRKIREYVNEVDKTWRACTFDGTDGMTRSIEAAALGHVQRVTSAAS